MSDLLQQELDRVAKSVSANPPNGREEVALLAPRGSIGVECGVDTGQLSKRILDLKHLGTLHSVDKWDDHAHSRFQYLAVSRLLMSYTKSKLWRMTAQEFSGLVEDESFGFVYIDCYAHTGQDKGEVLTAIWPKLAPGGIFAGDDYDERVWPRTYEAVNKFATANGCEINVRNDWVSSTSSTHDLFPTWWIRK